MGLSVTLPEIIILVHVGFNLVVETEGLRVHLRFNIIVVERRKDSGTFEFGLWLQRFPFVLYLFCINMYRNILFISLHSFATLRIQRRIVVSSPTT